MISAPQVGAEPSANLGQWPAEAAYPTTRPRPPKGLAKRLNYGFTRPAAPGGFAPYFPSRGMFS